MSSRNELSSVSQSSEKPSGPTAGDRLTLSLFLPKKINTLKLKGDDALKENTPRRPCCGTPGVR